MKQTAIAMVVLFILSCQPKQPTNEITNAEPYDLRGNVMSIVTSIGEVNQEFIEGPVDAADYLKNELTITGDW